MTRVTPRLVGELLVGAVPHLDDRLVGVRIERAWASIVGAEVARRARPTTCVNGTLTVVVDNSPWLHELTLRTAQIQAEVSGRFPAVRAVRFALETSTHATPRESGAPRRRRAVPLTSADVAEIDAAAAAIADPALADAVRRVMTTARRHPVAREDR